MAYPASRFSMGLEGARGERTPLAGGKRTSYASTATVASTSTSTSTSTTTSASSSAESIPPQPRRRCHRVKPLKICHIRRATQGAYAALRHDTASCYFKAADESPLAYEFRETFGLSINFADAVYRRKALTIGRGDSVIIYVPGCSKSGPVLPRIAPLIRKTYTPELAERKREFVEMLWPMLDSALGERTHDMLEIQSLATAPAKQGRGYASTLVRVVNDLADSLGRGVYVITTDAYRFYERLGYKLVGEVWIGDGNPRWNGPAAAIRLMVREPRAVLPPMPRQAMSGGRKLTRASR